MKRIYYINTNNKQLNNGIYELHVTIKKGNYVIDKVIKK